MVVKTKDAVDARAKAKSAFKVVNDEQVAASRSSSAAQQPVKRDTNDYRDKQKVASSPPKSTTNQPSYNSQRSLERQETAEDAFEDDGGNIQAPQSSNRGFGSGVSLEDFEKRLNATGNEGTNMRSLVYLLILAALAAGIFIFKSKFEHKNIQPSVDAAKSVPAIPAPTAEPQAEQPGSAAVPGNAPGAAANPNQAPAQAGAPAAANSNQPTGAAMAPQNNGQQPAASNSAQPQSGQQAAPTAGGTNNMAPAGTQAPSTNNQAPTAQPGAANPAAQNPAEANGQAAPAASQPADTAKPANSNNAPSAAGSQGDQLAPPVNSDQDVLNQLMEDKNHTTGAQGGAAPAASDAAPAKAPAVPAPAAGQ